MKRISQLILLSMLAAFRISAQEKQPYADLDSLILSNIPPNEIAINDYIRELSKKKLRDQHECFVVIKNVSIIDAENNTVKKHRTIIQHDGVIIEIKRNLFYFSKKGIKVINGRGMYLAPGLTDMHVHFACTNRDRLAYLLYGVTTIRNMEGSEFHLEDKYYIESKELLSPKLYTCGPSLSDKFGVFPDTASIKRLVRRQAEQGYDFIRAERTMKPESFYALLQEANLLGIKVAAEIPSSIDPNELIKYKDIVTIEGFQGNSVNKKILLENAAQSWHCPNMIATADVLKTKTSQQFLKKDEASIASDIQNSLIVKSIINQYFKILAPVYKTKSSFYKAYVKAGGRLLAGTESGTNTPMLISGASIHAELKELQLLGLTPDQVILTATLNPSKVMDAEQLAGSIQVGKRADFVLLTENPLIKIENYKSIYGVMINGTWLSPDDLKEIKNKLEVIK